MKTVMFIVLLVGFVVLTPQVKAQTVEKRSPVIIGKIATECELEPVYGGEQRVDAYVHGQYVGYRIESVIIGYKHSEYCHCRSPIRMPFWKDDSEYIRNGWYRK